MGSVVPPNSRNSADFESGATSQDDVMSRVNRLPAADYLQNLSAQGRRLLASFDLAVEDDDLALAQRTLATLQALCHRGLYDHLGMPRRRDARFGEQLAPPPWHGAAEQPD